ILRYGTRTGDPRALEMVRLTLDGMARGGMYDQLGGGFHRYSVDDQWLVPHFVKMLYDNAQLASLYLHAWLATGNPMYGRVAAELGLSADRLSGLLAQARQRLYAARDKRVHPGLDDKVLASWNGLVLSALAEAGRALGRSDYLAAAVDNGRFLTTSMMDGGR